MDLFEREQAVLDTALSRAASDGGMSVSGSEYAALAEEYNRILNLLRRTTRFADRAASVMNEKNVSLENRVYIDALTGIYNRRYFEEQLRRLIKSLSRADGFLSIMMLDVDRFKQYNDHYGHSQGDICLRMLAEAFTECVTRNEDFVARYGGEEFAVVLPNTDEAGAHVTTVRLMNAVRARDIPHIQSDVADCVTVSVGVTTVRVKHTHSADEYVRRADEALYRSKRGGRDKYTFLSFEGGAN